MIHNKFRYILTLVALLAVTTGAWAAGSDALAGVFTINASGDKVQFSKGNLQYVGTWKFADNQWEVYGSSQTDGHRDLFGWGSANNPDLTSENNNDYSTFTDWGTKIGDGTTWRTLTNDEWNYVLITRAASTLNGTENARYAYATVNGVGGLILFPDNYTHPGTVAAPAQINTPSNAFNANTYDVYAWDAMEDAGAVFLPHGGCRTGSTYQSNQPNYWSSTPISETLAHGLNLSGMEFKNWFRFRGCSVRLVRKPATATAVDIAWNAATKTGTFKQPAGNVELQVEYYPGMLTLPASLTGGKLSVEGLTDPFTKLEVLDAWKDDNTLLSATHLSGLKEMTDAEAQNWTDVPSGYVILIYGFDGTKAKLAPYFDGELTFPGSEEVTLSQLKEQSAVAEIYYSSEAQMPAGFEQDEEGNIYVADKTEFQVKAVPAEGYRLVSLMFGETDVTDQVDADGIATLTMPEGNADITLTATFSNEYNVALNAEGLSDEEAANWKAATGDNDPAAFPLENVKYGTEVKVTYSGSKKVIGVKAEKKVEPKKLTVGNVTFYYDEGQTFTEAKQKYADLNSGWILNGPYISVQGAISIVLFKGESPVEGTSKIEPNAEYSWINFS